MKIIKETTSEQLQTAANDFYDGHANVFLIRGEKDRAVFKLMIVGRGKTVEVFWANMFEPNAVNIPGKLSGADRDAIINTIVVVLRQGVYRSDHMTLFYYKNAQDTLNYINNFLLKPKKLIHY